LRIGVRERPDAMIRPTTPRSSSTSRLRGCSPLAREPDDDPSAPSMTRTAIPLRARSQAATNPTGPAPTTSTWILVERVPFGPAPALVSLTGDPSSALITSPGSASFGPPDRQARQVGPEGHHRTGDRDTGRTCSCTHFQTSRKRMVLPLDETSCSRRPIPDFVGLDEMASISPGDPETWSPGRRCCPIPVTKWSAAVPDPVMDAVNF
jgi:hypothetical protein